MKLNRNQKSEWQGKYNQQYVHPLNGHLSNSWREDIPYWAGYGAMWINHSGLEVTAYHRLQTLGELVCFHCIFSVSDSHFINWMWPVIHSLFCWNSEKTKQSIFLRIHVLDRKTHLYWLYIFIPELLWFYPVPQSHILYAT